MTPLRQRMLDAMSVRGFRPSTQQCYADAIYGLAKHYRGDPTQYSAQEIEAYLLHLVQERHLSYSTMNQAASAARFLYEKVLGHERTVFHIPMAKVPAKQPELLAREEIAQLFAACWRPTHRMLLQTIYAAGLRVSEACALRVGDIDSHSDRLCIRVACGKGGKGRYTLLSATLLGLLRTWTQDLQRHIHLHAVMARGVLGKDGNGCDTWHTPTRKPDFLFLVQALSKVFWGKFMAALKAAHEAGKIGRDPQADERSWCARQRQLYQHDWVVYAKTPLGGPAQVLEYLSRYTHRTAISNERIRFINEHEVAFSVRADEHGANRNGKRLVRLDGGCLRAGGHLEQQAGCCQSAGVCGAL